MDNVDLNLVCDDWPVKAWFSSEGRAQNGKLGVIFSSIGHVHDKYPPPELVKNALENFEHVLFLSDISRSWMNAHDVDQIFLDVINRISNQVGPTTISMAGISMGGFNALIMSSLIETDMVLAFNPQFSPMWRHVPEEKRWRVYRKALRNHKFPYVRVEAVTADRCIILHGSTKDEMAHAMRFGQSDDVEHYIFNGFDHNLARRLKANGLLTNVFNGACSGHDGHFLAVAQNSNLDVFPAAILRRSDAA